MQQCMCIESNCALLFFPHSPWYLPDIVVFVGSPVNSSQALDWTWYTQRQDLGVEKQSRFCNIYLCAKFLLNLFIKKMERSLMLQEMSLSREVHIIERLWMELYNIQWRSQNWIQWGGGIFMDILNCHKFLVRLRFFRACSLTLCFSPPPSFSIKLFSFHALHSHVFYNPYFSI